MDYLVHHGILGMKWGVRRYQNPDGSLTEAGKKRYKVDSSVTYEEAKLRSSKNKKDYQQYKAKIKSETDTRNLKGAAKAEREKEILESIGDKNASTRNFDRVVELDGRIREESGDWYHGEPVSENFAKIQAAKDEIRAAIDAGRNKVYEQYSKTLSELEKEQSNNQYRDKQGYLRDTPKSREAYKKWRATMDKREEEISKYYESDEYKNLQKRRNALNYDLLGVVLKDIGYNDTPENRKLIEPLVFWD